MENRILVGGTVLMLAAMAASGAESMNNDPGPQPDRADFYRANELALDGFGTASLGKYSLEHLSGSRVRQDTEFGAGVGPNYFITRNFGIGADIYAENTTGVFVDSASANLILRLPLGHSGFAPSVYGGGGRQFDLSDVWFAQLGAGMEYRFTRYVGDFLDARWVLPDETKYYGIVRLGIRFAF